MLEAARVKLKLKPNTTYTSGGLADGASVTTYTPGGLADGRGSRQGSTFVLGTFYRSASLYHPQRRAILHLKSQKRKIKNKDKEKNKAQDDRPPYFDFTTLRSRTIQILLLSIFVSSFGMNAPIFYLVRGCNTSILFWEEHIFSSIYMVYFAN